MPDRGAFEVQSNADIFGLLLLNQLAQHRREAVDGVGGQAFGVAQVANCIVGPIDMGHAINQKQPFGAHGDPL